MRKAPVIWLMWLGSLLPVSMPSEESIFSEIRNVTAYLTKSTSVYIRWSSWPDQMDQTSQVDRFTKSMYFIASRLWKAMLSMIYITLLPSTSIIGMHKMQSIVLWCMFWQPEMLMWQKPSCNKKWISKTPQNPHWDKTRPIHLPLFVLGRNTKYKKRGQCIVLRQDQAWHSSFLKLCESSRL